MKLKVWSSGNVHLTGPEGDRFMPLKTSKIAPTDYLWELDKRKYEYMGAVILSHV